MRHHRKFADGYLERWPLYATIIFILVGFVLGGASRPDEIQHAILRPLAIMLALIIVCFAPRIDWRALRWPGAMLLALALLMAVQLIPLPYSWWTALPGRELAREAMELTSQTGTAHGVSLTPDRTLNSLFALAVPAATLLAMGALGQGERRIVLAWLVGAMLVSLLFGFVQLVQGRFYLYDITNQGSAVGFFANRNHNAVLIAATLPLLACLATWPVHKREMRSFLLMIAASMMVLAVLAILTIGSRWGLAMAGLALAWSLLVAWPDVRELLRRQSRPVRTTILVVPLVLLSGLIVMATLGSRDETLRRLSEVAVADDIRIQTLPTTAAMMGDMMPLGTGFGSFDPVYRMVEPSELLGFQYLNHVHNDYVELIIEAGLPGLVLLVVALAWFATRALASFRQHNTTSPEGFNRRIAQAAAGVVLIALLASITDYPVRTPIWMIVLAICAVWLAGTTRSPDGKTHGSRMGEHASSPPAHNSRD